MSKDYALISAEDVFELESELARLRAELSTQETLVATLQEQQYAWDELQSENARLRAELEEAKKIFTCDETRSIHCSIKEYPVAALIISYQTYGSGDTPGADYMIKCANLDRAIKEGYGDSLLIMLSVIGEQILIAKRNFNAAAPAAGAPSSYRNALKEGNG